MSRISKEKQDRIKEDILREMFENYPEFEYTESVAEKIIRDNEFTLKLLKEMKRKNLINEIRESSGRKIKRKWQMKKEVYYAYKDLI
jgi:hypothetical protein